jgi:hypothetical protein
MTVMGTDSARAIGRRVQAVAWVLLGLLVLAACSGAPEVPPAPTGPFSPPAADETGPIALERVAASPVENVASALDDPTNPDLPAPLVDLGALVPGGPPPDGIPPIDEPVFERASSVTWLGTDEPVLSLQVDGEVRAYPVRVMIWHEIVNDLVGGIPVAVTYCPLCNSALTFDRRVADRVLSFGTSGLLYQSDLVMYDRQTRSLWPQLEGGAVAGVLTGTELETIPTQTVAWSAFLAAHPDAWVLSQQTGHRRPYGSNPYVGYDNPEGYPFLYDGSVPPQLPAMARVVGMGEGSEAVAIPLERLTRELVLTEEVDGQAVVLWLQPGLRSPLDAAEIDESKRIGAVGVFDPRWDGQDLTFQPEGTGTFVDEQTGSTWNILGEAIAGPAAGDRLEPVDHVDTFWFAWAAFQPGTRLAS